MTDLDTIFLAKADESLAGAESEYANGRYNNAANRCYYASFQAAIHALSEAGIAPRGADSTWSHSALQAQFAEQFINRRKLYPSEFGSVLLRNHTLRETADYESHWVTEARPLERFAAPAVSSTPFTEEVLAISSERLNLDPRRQQAVEELIGKVRAKFPHTSFRIRPGIEDPEETYLTATVDIDDPDEVMDLVADRLLELQMIDGIPIYVLPLHTPERALATMHQTKRARKSSAPLPPAHP